MKVVELTGDIITFSDACVGALHTPFVSELVVSKTRLTVLILLTNVNAEFE